jgi:8-oxo-dGTP pyrophosphatase MutT (NUDIX family)
MSLTYAPFTQPHLQYRYCPMCTGKLADSWDADGLFRPTCADCGWVYYPPNILGVAVVVTTSEGIVFLLPPGEPADTPAALPAGCVEFGETLEDAARREAREETGLEVEIVRELPGRIFRRDLGVGPMLQFGFEARMVGGQFHDSVEGRVAVYREGAYPAISPRRAGSLFAWAAYLASR